MTEDPVIVKETYCFIHDHLKCSSNCELFDEEHWMCSFKTMAKSLFRIAKGGL